jgi:hypothetical protein
MATHKSICNNELRGFLGNFGRKLGEIFAFLGGFFSKRNQFLTIREVYLIFFV